LKVTLKTKSKNKTKSIGAERRAAANGTGAGTGMRNGNGISRIRASLHGYADRGVFRGLNEEKSGTGKYDFTFVWLTERPLDFHFDSARSVMRFRNLLPNVELRSPVYESLKVLVKERQGDDLPAHKRIDRARAEIACSRRDGNVSIALTIKNNEYDYGVNRLINLVHELFVHLQESHFEYLAANFNISEE
jgi:hypothetical protein